jgi:hypothetical protein
VNTDDFAAPRWPQTAADATTLEGLHLLGYRVEIVLGRLRVTSRDGSELQAVAMAEVEKPLVNDLLHLCGRTAFVYEGYSVGFYGQARASGLNMIFCAIENDDRVHSIFNVDLTRQRKSKLGRKGSRLPAGHFRVGIRSNFVKFWKMTGLATPKSGASYHDYMGNLKRGLMFEFSGVEFGRVQNPDIQLLQISEHDIQTALTAKYSSHTNNGYDPDNSQTKCPDGKLSPDRTGQGLQPYQTTAPRHYETSQQDRKITSHQTPDPRSTRVEDQSAEEWLTQYNNHRPL